MEKYIFLDFNGTVLDDVDLCLNLLNTMLVEKKHKALNLVEYKNVFTFPIIEYYKKAGFDFVGYTFNELADYFIVEYTKRNVTEASIYPDFSYFMDEVKKKGYKVVLCSASKKVLLIDQLKEFDIYDRFDDVIGLDDHFAVSKLELAKEYIKNKKVDLANSYFIGDTTHDAEVGVECGLNVLLIERGHQSKEVLNSTKKPVLSSFVDVLKVL
jgi:phosphoglycolate phosphatase